MSNRNFRLESQRETRLPSLDRRPVRSCSCGLILGSQTCPVCLEAHTWYHMTVATGAGWDDHYVSCDKYVKPERTTWFLVKDLSHRVEVHPEGAESETISTFELRLRAMPLSQDSQNALKEVEAILVKLQEAEETVLQSSSRVLADNTIASLQRIQISNLFVNSSANVRNSIIQIQQALQAARQI